MTGWIVVAWVTGLIVFAVLAVRDILRDFPRLRDRINGGWGAWKDWWLT